MAVTLRKLVERYSGDTGVTDIMNVADDAVLDVIGLSLRSKPESFYEFSQEVAFTDTYPVSTALGVKAITNVSQKQRPCNYVPPNKFFDAVESDSIYLATVYSPIWTYKDNALVLRPITSGSDGLAEVIIPDSEIAVDTTATIDNFPTYLYDAWAMRTAMPVLISKIGDVNTLIQGLSLATLSISTSFPIDINTADVAIQGIPNFITTKFSGLSPLSIATELGVITNLIADDWDEGLASAKANEIAAKIQGYTQNLGAIVQEVNTELSEYQASDSRYTLALQRYQADIGNEVQVYQSTLQNYGAKVQAYTTEIQSLSAQYQMVSALFAMQFDMPTQGGTAQ